jgi:hypothetical protein
MDMPLACEREKNRPPEAFEAGSFMRMGFESQQAHADSQERRRDEVVFKHPNNTLRTHRGSQPQPARFSGEMLAIQPPRPWLDSAQHEVQARTSHQPDPLNFHQTVSSLRMGIDSPNNVWRQTVANYVLCPNL